MSTHTGNPVEALKVRWEAGSNRRLAMTAFVIGALGTAATLFGTTMEGERQRAFASYLFAYVLFLALALGSLFFVLIQHLTAARWSATVRRLAEAAMSTLPLFAVLFVPIVFGAHDLFHWTHEDVVANDAILKAKQPYLNLPFFYVRAAIYFVAWTAISTFLWRRSVAADAGDAETHVAAMRKWSAPALPVFGLTLTFAAFDWLMSLDPHWFSTMFGVYYFAGAVQGALALLVLTAILLNRSGLLEGTVTVEHYHDLGKLLFGFTVFFAYIAYCQYFLIWYSNMPEETWYYVHRWDGWAGVSLALLFLGFVFPFLTLMSRWAKRTEPVLLVGALMALTARVIDAYWLVLPNFDKHGPHLSWTTLTAFVGIGGLFVGLYLLRLGQNALVAVGDPYLSYSLRHENV